MNPSIIQQKTVTLPFDTFTLHPFSDIHIEDPLSNRKALNERLDSLRSEDLSHRIVLLGDLMDAAIMGSKGFWHGAPDPDQALDLLLDTFKDFSDRIDLVMPGNHEHRIERAAGVKIIKRFAQILQIEHAYSPEMTILKYKHGLNSHKVFCHHGYGGGKRTGSAVNNIEDLAKISPDCDVYLAGHVHKLGVTCDSVWLAGELKRRFFVMTNTYLGYVQYAKDKGLAPGLNTGAPVITFDSDVSVKI